ncbi:PREDICTED: ankyrin-1-like [Priapulus caudatus]|uniref:Ankyrin-1-like n=1 Tax=Priapulus caudatus TaxID=37621 RepID=A0ABM1DZL4_PRICU|nr:PREDICTED: ankyrin-1-like [Priapulus caudatus]
MDRRLYSRALSPERRPIAATQHMQRQLADEIGRHASADELRILLATGARAAVPVLHGLTPLHYAVFERHVPAARLMLVRGGNVNALDDVGYSPLHLAAEKGYSDVINLLCEFGAQVAFPRPNPHDMFPRDDQPEEPLRLAIKHKHFAVAEILLKHGANPNTRYFMGAEINLLAADEYVLMDILLRYGADVDSRDRTGITPLMKACKHGGCLETMIVLLSHAADVNARATARQDHRTALHYAVLAGDEVAATLLLQRGARVNLGGGYDAPTPLDVAILRDDLSMIVMLMEAGADVNAISSSVGTPLHVACAARLRHQAVIVHYLLAHGADPNRCRHYADGASLKTPLVEYLNKLLASVAERTDVASVRCTRLVPDDARALLERICCSPPPLTQLVRRALRGNAGRRYCDVVEALPLPSRLIRFLLFEFS